MITPAWAPSTPASHDPAVLTTTPSSYSFVFSPRYQTFPHASCAYQSNVFSTNSVDVASGRHRRDARRAERDHGEFFLRTVPVPPAEEPEYQAPAQLQRPVRG